MSRHATAPARVLRIIARMNVGGPAYHVSLLTGRLPRERYESLLVTGCVGPGEASYADLAERYEARVAFLRSLGPEMDPRRDRRALRSLMRLMRDFRPDIVHTHTAKAGAIGRLATPQLVREPGDAHGATRIEQEEGEKEPLARPAQLHGLAVAQRSDRTENPVLETRRVACVHRGRRW